MDAVDKFFDDAGSPTGSGSNLKNGRTMGYREYVHDRRIRLPGEEAINSRQILQTIYVLSGWIQALTRTTVVA